MERVLIVGCSGSGKSTLARHLSRETKLPLIHLDQHYWQPGWVEHDSAEWPVTVPALAAEPRWIMDGNYSGTLDARLAAADTVIWLDFPRRVCLWCVLLRMAASFGQVREDMAPGCPEKWDWEFLMYVWNYNRGHRPRVAAALAGFHGKLITLRQPREMTAFVASPPNLGA